MTKLCSECETRPAVTLINRRIVKAHRHDLCRKCWKAGNDSRRNETETADSEIVAETLERIIWERYLTKPQLHDQEKAMQCDNCGREIRKPNTDEHISEVVTQFFGFNFCRSLFETCRSEFTHKLFRQAAQAHKQAERKTESQTPEVSASQGTLVERITGKR